MGKGELTKSNKFGPVSIAEKKGILQNLPQPARAFE